MASLGEITDSNVEPIIREELLRLGRGEKGGAG